MKSDVSDELRESSLDSVRSDWVKPDSSKVFICLLLFFLIAIYFLIRAELDLIYVGIFLVLSGFTLLILFIRIGRDFQTEVRNSRITKFEQDFHLISNPIELLIANPNSSSAYSDLLKLVVSRVDSIELAIYSFNEQNGLLSRLAISNDENTGIYPVHTTPAVLHMIDQSTDRIVNIGIHFKSTSCYGIGLFDDEALFGFLAINRKIVESTETNLLLGFSSQLSRIICSSRLAQINRRQDLYQERSVIARELHDSLAQSLTYLKIQLTRIQTHIDKNKQSRSTDYSQIENAIQELRSNLNLAYGQLRELMTTFRLTMNGKDLRNAIEDSIGEFRQRTNIAFDTDIRISGEELSAQEELQLLQIVREALSNVVRHSQASRAKISLSLESNQIELILNDNGVGLAQTPDQGQHHGLVIMQERTRRLGGDLKVDGSESGGTRIRVCFTPESLNPTQPTVEM